MLAYQDGADIDFDWRIKSSEWNKGFATEGNTFLIEFDNTTHNANHIHIVWRDFNGDFGVDLLNEHYKKSKHHHK